MKSDLKNLHQCIEIRSVYLPDRRPHLEQYRNLLDGAEIERAAKFRRPDDAAGFILCRGLLRQILADCVQADPAGLRFERTAQGKPFLKDHGLEFNLSHSRDRLLVAVTAGRAVGVDIEFRRSGLNMESIVSRWFAPEEQAFFQGLENPEAGFFDIWAKKEAYVKALGTGIYNELNSFAVPLGETAHLPALENGGQWFFQTLEIDAAYAAAVVAAAPVVPVHIQTRVC